MVSKRPVKKNIIGFMQGRLVPSEKKNRIQYFPDKNWIKELTIARLNNYKVIEWTVNIENIKKNPIFLKKESNNLKKILKKNKIKVHSVTCDFFMQRPFFKNKKYNFILRYLKTIIENAQYIGVRYFILPLVDQASIKNKKQEDILIKILKKFEKCLKKDSQILFEIDYEPEKLSNFISKFNNKKFGINYDTGNSAGIGYKIINEKIYFNYVKNIHLKDKKLNGASVRLGNGDFEFKAFFKLMKKINYKGCYILQTARTKKSFGDLNELNINRDYINKFL